MNSFESLGLAAPLLKALAVEGYDHPTPIQAQAIRPVLSGRDLVGIAQTGTGKTAAFALPILHRLGADRRHAGARACRTLVLAPTRELAAQIGDSFRAYGKFIGLSTAIVFGGVPIGKQIRALERGLDVLVATPGRLLDLISQRACRLDAVEILVLDEADHMMDLGFIAPLRRIAKILPKQRQTLFFSATMPSEIEELAHAFINEPVRIAVAPVASTAERVTQGLIHVEQARKQALLEALLEAKAVARALVFSRTKHGANRIQKRLHEAGFPAEAIHGNKSQGQRERALEAFKKGRARLLIATEIAARGIDVDNVTHVINFDLPDVPEQYVHRIGRTARAGAEGAAISFCAPDERANLRDIERLLKKPVPVMAHALGLPTPQAGERLQRQAPRKQRPHEHKASHVRTDHGKRAKPRSADVHAERDTGDRRPAAPHAGERTQKQAPRKQRPHEHKASHVRTDHGKGGAKPRNAEAQAQRDAGDRRDRKGHQVWSNSASPSRGGRKFKQRRN